jgi:hypothetical protein
MTDKFEMPLKLAIKGKNLLSYLEKASSIRDCMPKSLISQKDIKINIR